MVLIDRDVLKSYATGGVTSVGLLTLAEIDKQPTIDPVHAAGGCYCRECGYQADCIQEVVISRHDNALGEIIFEHGKVEWCSYGRRREGAE